MSRRRNLRSRLLVTVGCGLLLAAIAGQPHLHRGLIVFGVVALMLGVSSALQRHMMPLPPPEEPYYRRPPPAGQ
jgi:hypothetical protein